MILEPKQKNFAGPSEIKETVKQIFNIRRHMSTPRAFECYYFNPNQNGQGQKCPC